MQIKNIMEAMLVYIKEQDISFMQIFQDTKIDISSRRNLTASEFLVLCDYLRMRPEDFIKIAEDMGNDSVSL